MRREEAYQELGLSPDASEEEAKKKYRDLSRKMHPDVNKEPGAEDKFKRINEAYTRIKNNDFQQEMPPGGFSGQGGFGGFSGFNGFPDIEDLINFHSGFSSSSKKRNRPTHPIQLSIVISFKESIFGIKKELSYSRKIKCDSCEGSGGKLLNNGCDACGGKGRSSVRRGNMIINSTCNKCNGRVKQETCTKCSGEGGVDSQTSISINIPPGIENNNTLRLSNIGNFVDATNFGDRHTDVYVHVQVIQDPNFKLENDDVVSTISISLLDAISGSNKEVVTLDGMQTIEIKPLSKHRDEVIIPNLGVARKGNQRVVLQIEYPSDIESFKVKLQELN